MFSYFHCLGYPCGFLQCGSHQFAGNITTMTNFIRITNVLQFLPSTQYLSDKFCSEPQFSTLTICQLSNKLPYPCPLYVSLSLFCYPVTIIRSGKDARLFMVVLLFFKQIMTKLQANSFLYFLKFVSLFVFHLQVLSQVTSLSFIYILLLNEALFFLQQTRILLSYNYVS